MVGPSHRPWKLCIHCLCFCGLAFSLYNHSMRHCSMQPSSKLQGLLMLPLSQKACPDSTWLRRPGLSHSQFEEMSKDAGQDAFELQLAMVNAYGEDGKVQECYDQVKKMLSMHPNIAALVTWGYNAVLKAYRWVLAS